LQFDPRVTSLGFGLTGPLPSGVALWILVVLAMVAISMMAVGAYRPHH
jgi:hypothetical protein